MAASRPTTTFRNRGATDRRPAASEDRGLPAANIRSLMTVALVMHLAMVAVGISAVFRPSPLQQRLMGVFAPYLRPLHLAVDTQPLYLTHGSTDDQPHRFEVRVRGDADARWRAVRPEGVPARGARSARFERWAQVTGELARADQMVEVADLAGAASRHWQARTGRLPVEIRVSRDEPRSDVLVFPPPVETVEEYVANVFAGKAVHPELARRSAAVEVAHPVSHRGGSAAGPGGSETEQQENEQAEGGAR